MSSPQTSTSLRSRQQRQRRAIVHHEQEERQMMERISKVQHASNRMLDKIFGCIVIVLFIAVFLLIFITRPNLLPWNRKPVPKCVLVSFFPPFVNRKHDLPHVVGSYSIVTSSNLKTRQAIQYALQQRKTLRSPALKLVWFLWEQEQADRFIQNDANICRDDFHDAYRHASPALLVQHDMILWCLLSLGRVHGRVEYGIDFTRQLYPYYRHMAVRRVGEDRIVPSILISHANSSVPSAMLEWAIEYTTAIAVVDEEWNESIYRRAMEEHLFRLIQEDTSVDWYLLNAVCEDEQRRSNEYAQSPNV